METIEKVYKYNCETCNFRCNEKSRWQIHIDCIKHKTGKKKIRSDYKESFKCEKCEYETKNIVTYKEHILNEHSNRQERKEGFKHYCELCDYGSMSTIIYERHEKTEKHKKHEKNYI